MTSAITLTAVAVILRGCPRPLIAFRVQDHSILGANEAAYELLGRAPGSFDGLRTIDILSPGDRRNAEATRSMLASGALDSTRSVRRFQRGDGTELTVNVYVQIVVKDGERFCLAVLDPEGRRTVGRTSMAASRLALP